MEEVYIDKQLNALSTQADNQGVSQGSDNQEALAQQQMLTAN